VTRRIATALALVGFAAGIVGAGRVAGLLSDTIAVWTIEPIAFAALAVVAVRTQSVGFVWICIGAVWSFVILGAWSIGTFFFYEALALLAAGIAHAATIERRLTLALIPLWLVVAASLPAFAFLIRDWMQTSSTSFTTYGPNYFDSYSSSRVVTHAPAVVFLASCGVVALAILAVIRIVRRRQA